MVVDDRVTIFDTTLRDGEQTPGVALDADQKLTIAHALCELGVDVIETGFPAAGEREWQGIRRIANTVGRRHDTPSGEPPTICGLARATPSDIERAWAALADAERPRIHTFIAVSDVHLRHKLGMAREQVLDRVAAMVSLARSLCEDVEFSAEDATRADLEFLIAVLRTAVAAGARTLNIPDTVGYAMPHEYAERIAAVVERCVDPASGVVVSVHCHDDLGLATANSLAGLAAGARQAEVTINGIGERAGNAALEEVTMALQTRSDRFGLRTGIDCTRLHPTSALVSRLSEVQVPPNKAIVGANAFAHESGIHQDGVLKHRETYEIMSPTSVGASGSRLVLGKHSGRHAVRARLAELGHPVPDGDLDDLFSRFKRLAESKRRVLDTDLVALVDPLRGATT